MTNLEIKAKTQHDIVKELQLIITVLVNENKISTNTGQGLLDKLKVLLSDKVTFSNGDMVQYIYDKLQNSIPWNGSNATTAKPPVGKHGNFANCIITIQKES